MNGKVGAEGRLLPSGGGSSWVEPHRGLPNGIWRPLVGFCRGRAADRRDLMPNSANTTMFTVVTFAVSENTTLIGRAYEMYDRG